MKKQIIAYHLLLIIGLVLPSNLLAKGAKANKVVKEIHTQKEIDDNLPAVIEFYRHDCAACSMFKEKFQKLAEKYPDINFLKVDSIKNHQLLDRYQKKYGQSISSLPYFGFVASHKTKSPKFVIGPNRHKIETEIKALLENAKHPNLIEVTSFQEFQDLAKKSDRLVVATYHASWCGHCKDLAPKLVELSDQHGNSAIFIKLNEAEEGNKAFAAKYLGQNFGFPTTCIFKVGDLEKPITTIAGANIPALTNAILQATQPAGAADTKTITNSTDNIVHIKNQAQLDDIIKHSTVPVIVEYHAERWCGPCQHYKATFANYSKNYTNLKFVKVDDDISENKKIGQSYNIKALPTTIIFEKGKETQKFSGADPAIEKILQALNKK